MMCVSSMQSLDLNLRGPVDAFIHHSSARTRTLREGSDQTTSPAEQVMNVQQRESAWMNVVCSSYKTYHLSISSHRKINHPYRIMASSQACQTRIVNRNCPNGFGGFDLNLSLFLSSRYSEVLVAADANLGAWPRYACAVSCLYRDTSLTPQIGRHFPFPPFAHCPRRFSISLLCCTPACRVQYAPMLCCLVCFPLFCRERSFPCLSSSKNAG